MAHGRQADARGRLEAARVSDSHGCRLALRARAARIREDFGFASARDAIVQLSAGNFGEAQIGKLITVYPRNDTEAVALAHELIERTRGIAGPRIATDLHLGEAVYARYGGVRPRITVDRLGEPTELIPDGSGNWVPDLRPVPFSCPQGIAIPFPTAGESEAAGRWAS